MMPNLFTTQIGTPSAPNRRRKRASAPRVTPTNVASSNMSSNKSEDARYERMSMATRKQCLRLAFDVLDPHFLGKVDEQTLRDIADEIRHLIQCGKNDQDRDTQRFMVDFPDEYKSTKESDERALKEAHDLEVTSEEDEPNSDSEDSTLQGFIVYSDEDEEENTVKKQKHCPVDKDEEDEDVPKKRSIKHIPVEDEEYDEDEATHLSEVD